MLAGILVDVSGSMKNSLQLHVQPTNQDVTRAQSIFTTIMNIVGGEVSSQKDHDVFVLAFGLQDIATCDLLALLDYIQTIDLKSDGKGHENLIRLLASNGAPYADQYVRKYVSERQAQFLFKFYSQNENRDLLADVVQKLPSVCTENSVKSKAINGGIFVLNFFNAPLVDWMEDRQTKEKIEDAMKYAKDVIRQRSLPKLKTMEQPRSKTFQSTMNLLKQVTGTWTNPSKTQSTFTSAQLSALVDSIEPFIYGETPMCKAIQSAVNTYYSSSHEQKVLFLLSDGESTDGNPVQFASKLHDQNVLVFACLLTSQSISYPRRLYYKADPNWSQAQKQMFELSSTVENCHSAMSILLEQGWELPADGHSRIFIQANHPDVIKEFSNLMNDISEHNDVLLNLVGRASLDMYINAANSSFNVTEQSGGTCYAHAVATVCHLAMRRIEGRENGVPDFDIILQQLIHAYGTEGANTENVLNVWAPRHRLHYKKVDELGARQAINRRRPVVATFQLDDQQWTAFSMFYKNHPQGVLESQNLGARSGSKLSGHAVVLMKCDPTSLTFINSWGTGFADKGFFRVRNQAVLNLQFYDVYWTLNDLTASEIQAFEMKSSEKVRNLIENLPPGIKNLPYECPNCHQYSVVHTYIIHFSDAECPKCHQRFKPTPSGLNVTGYTH
ncbi:unnamed protein product [Adineta steineri]|uniref:VWFA domain-containing protein n=1 Tax=Adineta steineri TaxID=433720 RepID=A0A814EQL0_9BILA|nr:unnamed protein product [Adineta steineri]CAF1301614.1 unnamed protein product [Adineta steineri]CAF1377975.1 unnamed protein product [Adineta steineri]